MGTSTDRASSVDADPGIRGNGPSCTNTPSITYEPLVPLEMEGFERIVVAFFNTMTLRFVGMRMAEEMTVMVSACAVEMELGIPDLV